MPEDAQEGKLNLLTLLDEEVKVKWGNRPRGRESSPQSLDRAMTDFLRLFAIRHSALSTRIIYRVIIFQFVDIPNIIETCGRRTEGSWRFHENRVALSPISEISKVITKERIIEKATIFHKSSKRLRIQPTHCRVGTNHMPVMEAW